MAPVRRSLVTNSALAIRGGPTAVRTDPGATFNWPIITKEDEDATLQVLRRGAMSGCDVTIEFEKEFASWQGTKYALACNNGTAALQSAMFGCRIGVGDELICPTVTYWASALPCFSLGATVVFAEIDPSTLCLDPNDIEQRITEHTKAIMVVHLAGHPADMDPIMRVARKHNLKVIEDVSHAQGGLYKGRKVGTFGHVAAMSLMTGKSFPTGEGGILVTDQREIYERALAWGHYSRFNTDIQSEELRPFAGLPLGGYKYRMHQISAAVGRVQLKYYDRRCEEIRKAMNYFWDCLNGVPGLQPHRTPPGPDSNMAGWYAPRGFYRKEDLGGLSATCFAAAVRAEGSVCRAGAYRVLHLHPVFNTCDIYGHGKPTRVAHSTRDVRQPPGSLPVSEALGFSVIAVPWFKRYHPRIIEEHVSAYRKAAEGCRELLEDDRGDPLEIGSWSMSNRN